MADLKTQPNSADVGTFLARVKNPARKQALTLYIMSGFKEYDDLLGQLGAHTTGK